MIGKTEKDNIYFSIVGIDYIDLYRKNDDVFENQTMRFYLNMIKGAFKKIENYYSDNIENDPKINRRILKKINEADRKIQDDPAGEHVALTEDDKTLVRVIDAIIYQFEIALEKSKHIPREVKTQMKRARSYWYGWEKYILKGAR